ncbi:Bcr/CflA family multidrug efflux MFS transporter [Parendozoicomonas haliclonae]|nr:Bcr/CflA family multidrug efflux MFS transporter [Parendozoicomonas haliclonae]
MLVVVLGILTCLGPMAIDLYLPALPAIAKAMGEPLGRIQLTLSAYTVGFALGQIVFGPLSDRFGRMKVMLPGIIGYVLTNFLASLADTAVELIAIRVLQAFSGAAIMVCIPAMVRDMFPRKECARILSSILLVMTVAPLVAPILGGQILKFFGWPSLFLFLSLLGGLAFILAFTRLRESLPEDNRSPMKPADLGRAYWNIVSHRKAMSYILAHGFFFGGMFAFISGSPFVYIELFGVSADNYGYLFALNVVMLGICNMINLRMMGRFELKSLLLFGCGMACLAGVILLLNAWTGFGGLFGIVVPCMLFMGMIGFTGPNSNALALEYFPKTAGTANAAAGVIRFGIGGITAGLAGMLHDGTAVPMTAIMAGCGVLSLAVLVLMGGLRNDGSEETPDDHEGEHTAEPLKAA